MNKKQFQLFCKSQGWSSHYSGNNELFYIRVGLTKATHEDVEVAITQHFGILPDWKLKVQ